MDASPPVRFRTRLFSLILATLTVGCTASNADAPADPPHEPPPLASFEIGSKNCSLALSPDGRTVVTLAGTTRFWDLATGRQLGESSARGGAEPKFSPDGRFLAMFTSGDLTQPRATLHVYAVNGATVRYLWAAPCAGWRGNSSEALHTSFSPDGRVLAVANPESHVAYVWELATGTERLHFEGAVAVAFSPDGTDLIAVRHDGGIQRFDATTGRPRHDVRRGRTPDFLWVNQVAFSADGRRVAIADWYTVLLKDTDTGDTLARIKPDSSVGPLHLATNDRLLLIEDRTGVAVYDSETGRERGWLYPRDAMVGALALSADGSQCVWAECSDRFGKDGVIRQCPTSSLPLTARRPDAPDTNPLKAELIIPPGDVVHDWKGMTPAQASDDVFRNGGIVRDLNWELRLTNVSNETVYLLNNRDAIRATTYLTGPGAINRDGGSRQTGFVPRDPDPRIAIEPGKHYSVPVYELNSFYNHPMWVMPGEYSVWATADPLNVSPPPRGSPDSDRESAWVTCRAAPVRITVREKK